MKKISVITVALLLIAAGSFAQTQRTSRTNSRSHYPADTTRNNNSRVEPVTDADRNNPTNTTNPKPTGTTPADNTNNKGK